jgi:hypothetical protein
MALPAGWPRSGSLRPRILARLAFHLAPLALEHSAETGTGKSTLLFSHLSRHHLVFAKDDTGDGDSLREVQRSPLLRRETVEFVVGPTQRTLPAFAFTHPLHAVLLDGPHAFPFPHLEYYHLYPALAEGGLLVLDDVHVRSVNDLFRFLRRDDMFALLEVARTTAFLRRTGWQTFDPLGDGWWLQRHNLTVLPPPSGLPLIERLKALIPFRLREWLRRAGRTHAPLGRHGGR